MALSGASKLRLKSYSLLGSSAVATMLSLAYLFGGLASLGPVMDDEASLKQLVRLVAADQRYKFLIPLLVPVGSYFVIANWIAFEFFRYA